ncbi:MAG: hypothetical protein J6X24_05185, partial [Firmicutes bacterium]|nr:hypothetical protein [Bacillota bacterium]
TMLDSYGSFSNEDYTVKFKAPKNYSGRDKCYRITVYSTEMNDVLFTVDVKVYPETEQLTNAISLWRTEEANVPVTPPPSQQTNNDNNNSVNDNGSAPDTSEGGEG